MGRASHGVFGNTEFWRKETTDKINVQAWGGHTDTTQIQLAYPQKVW